MKDQLNPTDARKEIEKLRIEIEQHNQLYYIEASPQISDHDYDALLRHLEDLEKQYALTLEINKIREEIGEKWNAYDYRKYRDSQFDENFKKNLVDIKRNSIGKEFH